MHENLKSVALLFLVLLSLGLTYHIWFGATSLKESAVPRYEYAYFKEPFPLKNIITPSKIIFQGGGEEEEHVFRRGEKEYTRLWDGCGTLLKRLGKQTLNRINDLDTMTLLQANFPKTIFVFTTPLPIAFFQPASNLPGLNIDRVAVIRDENYYHLILEGEEKFAGRIIMNLNEQLPGSLIPQGSSPHFRLPGELELDLLQPAPQLKTDVENENRLPGGDVPINGPGAKGGLPGGQEEKENTFHLSLENINDYIPLNNLPAAEIVIRKEDTDKDGLVKAFFLDQSMARLIEERDGATFFTDGEKGLRIYADELVEYTAPRPVHAAASISYGSALQKGAECLELYGRWPPGAYLTRAEKQSEGFHLFWKTFYGGLPIEGKHAGGEMVISDQGMIFYRRNFYQFIEETGEKKPFRPFEEALRQAVLIYRDAFPANEGILLEMEPVYYLFREEKGAARAIPAWSVSFAGLDKLYLHWQTLKPLPEIS